MTTGTKHLAIALFALAAGSQSLAVFAAEPEAQQITIAVIGTGDVGNSIGPALARRGYQVIYGSRDPSREDVQALVKRTGKDSSAKSQREAAQLADFVILAVPRFTMTKIAQSLGDLDGKIILDVSYPSRQGDDGYPVNDLDTSSAEVVQELNPGARVVKWSLPTAHYIEAPQELGQRPANWIASDDREAKELVARIAADIGQDPVDAGPLRMARAIEAQMMLFLVPLYQRREQGFEYTIRRTSFWECQWGDDWSEPVVDDEQLAEFPKSESMPRPCSDYPPWP